MWNTSKLQCWKINHPTNTDFKDFSSLNCTDYHVPLSGRGNGWSGWQSMYSLCVSVPPGHPEHANRRCQFAYQDAVELGGWASTGATMYNNSGVAQCPSYTHTT